MLKPTLPTKAGALNAAPISSSTAHTRTGRQAPLRGLIAATYTPMRDDQSLAMEKIAPLMEHLIASGVEGVFVCGSTGEGLSLTTEERLSLAEEAVAAVAGRIPVIVHVGHNSIGDARRLAAQAERLGVDAISTIAPGFYKPSQSSELVDFMARISEAAPETPLFYYHFPQRVATGIELNAILEQAAKRIPQLAGVKYTHNDFDELSSCRRQYNERYQFLFGRDELFLKSLQAGFHDFVGSTYNYALPIFTALRTAFQQDNQEECIRLQRLVDELLALIIDLPGFSGQKILMNHSGFDCGPSRCPLPTVDPVLADNARHRFEAILSKVNPANSLSL